MQGKEITTERSQVHQRYSGQWGKYDLIKECSYYISLLPFEPHSIMPLGRLVVTKPSTGISKKRIISRSIIDELHEKWDWAEV